MIRIENLCAMRILKATDVLFAASAVVKAVTNAKLMIVLEPFENAVREYLSLVPLFLTGAVRDSAGAFKGPFELYSLGPSNMSTVWQNIASPSSCTIAPGRPREEACQCSNVACAAW